jgi:coenzyme F420 hydrogenase subunit beta
MIRDMGVAKPADVRSVRYRGNGWPGKATVVSDGANGPRTDAWTYEKSWGDLQARRQWRCYVCADHTGELADVAVGDPWYRPIPAGEPGRSLVLPRTEKGRAFVAAAVEAGYLELETKTPDVLVRSQPNLLKTRGAIWGRILATRLLGAAAPRYRRMPMFPTWWRELTLREKVGSLLGTARRTFRKGLRERVPVREWQPGDEER